MQIYPKSKYLSFSMILCSVVGVFPAQFLFPNNPSLRRAYQTYSMCALLYYLYFLIGGYIRMYTIFTGGDISWEKVSANLSYTLITNTTLLRSIIMRWSKTCEEIILEVIDDEKEIVYSEDSKLKKMYQYRCNDIILKQKYYLLSIYATCLGYTLRPFLIEPNSVVVGNQTVINRPLPLDSWMPIDGQKHYAIAFTWEILNGIYTANIVNSIDITMFCLIAHSVWQLRILQYILKNFESYQTKLMLSAKISEQDHAAFVLFLGFIKRHKKVIRYVDRMNSCMSGVMLLDFLLSSLHIAGIITQIVGSKITLMLIFFVGTYFVGMVLRLFLYYYYANEVMVVSENMAFNIYKTNWYDQSASVKHLVLFIILRAHTPIRFRIGPFGYMTLEYLLMILKTTYSYTMLAYGSNV